MKRIRKLALWALGIGLLSILPLEAQPGGSGRGSGRGGGGGMSPEQIFSLLALNEKFNVTDEQLLALRGSLKPLYAEQQQMMSELFSGEGDFRALRQTLREKQMEIRGKVMTALTETLSEEQIEVLKTHMQEQQERRRNFGGRGGPRGGPRGGGGGGGGGF